MSKDDPRMHGHNTPGMVGGRGHERHEEPVRLNHPEPGEDGAPTDRSDTTGSMRDRHQPSALGGETATRSGTAPTPPDEREG